MADSNTPSDAWDYHGNPAERSKTGGWTSAAMILGVELNERMTTLGIAVNLVTYLTGTMHLGNAESANTVTNFLGTSFMLCLLGGFVADTFLGRYLTISLFASIQAIGVIILTVSTTVPSLQPPPCKPNSTCPQASGLQLSVLYSALYLTALGTGGLKSSVSGFGSDQFDESDPKEKSQMTNFFNWFFYFIDLGSLAAVTVLVYIQDHIGRKWGYGTCAICIVIGVIVLVSGTRKYRFKELLGSPLTQIAVVFVAAWRKRNMKLPSDPSLLYDTVSEGQSAKKEKLLHSKQLRFLDRAAILETDTEKGKRAVTSRWRLSPLTDVEEVKTVIRMLPIWATTIMFWTIYAQMSTFFVSQATNMDRNIASLIVFFIGSILLTVPVFDRIVAPVCRKLLGNPQGLSSLQRIGVGLVLSTLAMVAAALSEIKRLNSAKANGLTDDPNVVVPLSVFWLVPQFFLVGSGEAFTYIGQLDFFLKECPKGMKTMGTGLFLSTLALGFFFSSILVSLVHKATASHPWLADNLNQGKLHYFYWLLALLSLANFGAYLVSAKWYVYKESRLAEDGVEMENTDSCAHA